jgi:hypothetical protein
MINRRFVVLHSASVSKDKLVQGCIICSVVSEDGFEGLLVHVRTLIIDCVCDASMFGVLKALVQYTFLFCHAIFDDISLGSLWLMQQHRMITLKRLGWRSFCRSDFRYHFFAYLCGVAQV